MNPVFFSVIFSLVFVEYNSFLFEFELINSVSEENNKFESLSVIDIL